jgi:uncharacterized protein YcbK (DUF882 family)
VKALAIIAAMLAVPLVGLAYLMRRYNPAERADNIWTAQGVYNVMRLWPHFEKVIAAVAEKVTSGFRSPVYNSSTPGSSTTSDHMYGAALDLRVKKGLSVREAADIVFAMAKRGEIGDVAQVIEEHNSDGAQWLHVGWNHPAHAGRKVARLTLLDGKSAVV